MFLLRNFIKKLSNYRHFSQIQCQQFKNKTKWNLIYPIQFLLQDGNVLLSQSNDIYDNLAIEDWLYQNYDFSQNNEKLLLLWRNHPTVVVGRHQNIWREINIRYCQENQIKIARRNSGGGTVYHDLENLNVCFMTSKKEYNRKRNLSFIKDVLDKVFNIKTKINSREDLVVLDSEEKVSGTASKLNAYNSYHHCTLLIDVNRSRLSNSLRKSEIIDFESRATKSVPSPVLNLKTLNQQITIESVILELSKNFSNFSSKSSNIFQIFPSMFQDIDSHRKKFVDWSWIHGKTPQFSISNNFFHNRQMHTLKLTVDKGKISEIWFSKDFIQFQIIQNKMIGGQFCENDLRLKINELHSFWNTASKCDADDDNFLQFDTFCLALMSCYNKCQ